MSFHLTGKSHSLASPLAHSSPQCTTQIEMSCPFLHGLRPNALPLSLRGWEALCLTPCSARSESLAQLPCTPTYLWEHLTPRTATTHWRCKLFSTALGTTTVKIEWMSTEKRTWNRQSFTQVQSILTHHRNNLTKREVWQFHSPRPALARKAKASLSESKVFCLSTIFKVWGLPNKLSYLRSP